MHAADVVVLASSYKVKCVVQEGGPCVKQSLSRSATMVWDKPYIMTLFKESKNVIKGLEQVLADCNWHEQDQFTTSKVYLDPIVNVGKNQRTIHR